MDVQNFDATNIIPQQMGDKIPEGTHPFQISNTFGQENKAKDGGIFVVEFTTPVGSIKNYYNLWNKSTQAAEIAQKELSALCHAVGVFKLSFVGIPPDQYGRELRGSRGTIKVGPQTNNPDYMEVKKVFDAAGNEPGKGPAAAPQPQGQSWGGQQAAPATPQQPPQNNAPAPNSGSWGANQQAPAGPAPQGWQQGAPAQAAPQGGNAAAPPWARS